MPVETFRDFQYAARTLRRSPGFTLTAIAALALGIGSNTAIFSVVNKVLLEPLPYPHAERLVQLMSASPLGDQHVASIPKYLVWRDYTTVYEYIAAYDAGGPSINLTESDPPESLRAARVSADYFSLFGAQVAAGRTFTAKEDSPRGPRVVVISDGLWRRRFGGRLSILDRTVSLENQSYRVIGILEPGFAW